MNDCLLGVADLAALVGKSKRTVGGWRARNIVPDTEARIDVRGTLIWRASTVLAALSGRGFYDGPVPDPMPMPDLVSYLYVQELTGKDARAVQWMLDPRSGVRLPDPEWRLSTVPLWRRETIDAWHAKEQVTA